MAGISGLARVICAGEIGGAGEVGSLGIIKPKTLRFRFAGIRFNSIWYSWVAAMVSVSNSVVAAATG